MGKVFSSLILALTLTVLCSAQGSPDWSACESAENSLRKQVEELQKTLPEGFDLRLECVYRGTQEEQKKSPERHVQLTSAEIRTLHEYRESAKAAYELQDAFERHLLVAHHLPILDYGDPCYRFIGIKMDDDFITDDPNPFMPWECHSGEAR